MTTNLKWNLSIARKHITSLSCPELPWWLSSKESAWQCRKAEFSLWVRKIPRRRKWQSIPVFLPGKSRGQRSLTGYSLQSCEESNMTEKLRAQSLWEVIRSGEQSSHDWN